MRRIRRLRVHSLAVALLAGLAWSSDSNVTDDAALQGLIAEALARRPELRAAEATLEAQRQLAPQVRALPDPMLEVGIQNDGFARLELGTMETSWISIMTSQTVPWPWKLAARGKLAELAPAQAEQALARLRLSTEADVRRAWVDLALARDRLVLLGRLEELWRQSAELARSRYEVGEGAQSDVLRAQLELNRVKQRRLALQAEERQSLQALNRLRAAPLETAIATPASLRDRPLPPVPEAAALVADALERSPERALTRLGSAAADAAVAVARQSWGPDVTFRAGLMPRGTTLPPMWLVSVGSTLPVWGTVKQARAVEEAAARLRAARADLETIEQLVALRSSQRLAAMRAIGDTLALYREGLLIQSQATAASTLAQYKVGKVGFLAVLEANAGYVADEDGYLRALADAWRLAIAAREVSLDAPPALGGAAMAAPVMAGSGAQAQPSAAGGTSAAPPQGGM